MEGYRIIFSTIRNRRHDGEQIHEWLIKKAKEIGIKGVTVLEAMEGYGRDKNIHSAGFFELVDQPIEIVMLADEEKCAMLFKGINEANLSVFYAKTKAEFGFTGQS
jgi:PII-like signaling protein